MARPPLRVVITGSECTGKTTIANQLAAHFGVWSTPEFVRAYAAHKGAPIDERDHWPIAQGQMAIEDEFRVRAQAAGHPLLLHDTDLVSTVAYSLHYHGHCLPEVEREASQRLADHYLLLDIDVPWVADGVRDRGHRREEVHAQFVETLTRLGAPFSVIRGSWEERFSRSRLIIEQHLPEP